MSAPLPLAVIGACQSGLRQARAAAECPEVELTAVIDPSSEGLERAEQSGFPVFSELDQAPERTRAAVVATPAPARAWLVEAAVARNWALLADRRLAHTLRDARRIQAAAEGAGVPLLVGHHRRHHACVAAAREAARGGLLGRVVAADAVWFLRRPQRTDGYAWRVASGGGPVLEHLLQELDLLRWLIGEIAEVTAFTSRAASHAAADEAAAVAIRFAEGGLATALSADAALSPWGWEAATGEADHIAQSGQDCLRIMGAEGALALPSLAYWRHSGEGVSDWSAPLSRLALPCPPNDPFVAQLSHFARVVEGAEAPMVSAEDGLRSLAAALAVEESARLGRAVVPDPDRPDAWEPTAAAIFRDLSRTDDED